MERLRRPEPVDERPVPAPELPCQDIVEVDGLDEGGLQLLPIQRDRAEDRAKGRLQGHHPDGDLLLRGLREIARRKREQHGGSREGQRSARDKDLGGQSGSASSDGSSSSAASTSRWYCRTSSRLMTWIAWPRT